MSATRNVIVVAFLAVLAAPPGDAGAERATGGTLWGGMEIGTGYMRRTAAGPVSDATLYLVLKGGRALSERLLVGVELGGHLLEAGDLWNPSRGAGVSQVFLAAQYYRQAVRRGWYARVGAGYVSYWDNRPGGPGAGGWGAMITLGHDWRRPGFGTAGPMLSVGYGKAGDLEHRAVAVGLSWLFP